MRIKPGGNATKRILLPLIGIAISVLLLAFSWWVATSPTPDPLGRERRLTQAQAEKFYDVEVLPAINEYDTRNQKAVERAVERIASEVERYRAGIKPFVKDITSWGTRFSVIRRVGKDLREKYKGEAERATNVHRYVTSKFEKHLFSDVKLNALVTGSLQQFRDDLAANQNRLHADVKAAWQQSAYAQHELDLQKIVQQVNASVQASSTKMATDSVAVGMIAFIGGYALEEAVEALVKGIVIRVGASMAASAATTTAASGGAAATTAVAGGTGGTVIGGPVGTVIGVVAGFGVGMVTDWWMTNQLEKKLTTECNQMVSDVKTQILVGTKQAPGLKYAFIDSVRLLKTGEEQAIHASLQEVAE